MCVATPNFDDLRIGGLAGGANYMSGHDGRLVGSAFGKSGRNRRVRGFAPQNRTNLTVLQSKG